MSIDYSVNTLYPHERTGIILCDEECDECNCERCELQENETDPVEEGFTLVSQED